MLEYLKFSIGSMEIGFKTIVLRHENEGFDYEIIQSGLLDVVKGKYRAKMPDNCLAKWAALGVSSWNEIYVAPDVSTGEAWRLTVQEDGVTYKVSGSRNYPPQWQQFLDWLDALVPEMEFVSPKRLEDIIFRYMDVGSLGTCYERLEISRWEQMVHFEKWGEPKSEEASLQYSVKSSHHYDFTNARKQMDGLMNLCQQFLTPPKFEESGALTRGVGTDIPNIHIWLKLHDGSTLNGCVGYSRVPGWEEFMDEIQRYMSDLTADIFNCNEYRIDLRDTCRRKRNEYIYCKVRFDSSYRLYSYRTEDATLQVGDKVDVPVGKENNVICGRIEKIEYFDEEHVPYPVNKTKLIIGKHENDRD